MIFLVALVVSSLLVSPASGGALLVKAVSTHQVDMDWTEVAPGLEVMIHGTFHNTGLLFTTDDPAVFRVVVLGLFHGILGIRGTDPVLGPFSLATQDRIAELRIVGTVKVDEQGVAVPIDAMLSLRTRGTVTLNIGSISETVDVNLLGIVQVKGGEVVWTRVGVPLGWPFQAP